MPSASPTGHWPRSPASTLSGSHLRFAGVETPLQRVEEVRRGHAGVNALRCRGGSETNRAGREITGCGGEPGSEVRQREEQWLERDGKPTQWKERQRNKTSWTHKENTVRKIATVFPRWASRDKQFEEDGETAELAVLLIWADGAVELELIGPDPDTFPKPSVAPEDGSLLITINGRFHLHGSYQMNC